MTRKLHRSHILSGAAAAIASAVTAVLLVVPGAAAANQPAAARQPVPAPPPHPTSADQIQNLDLVKTAIKSYYGDTIDPSRVNPIDGTPLHTFSATGSYVKEMGGIVRDAKTFLGSASTNPKRAVLFDVDDTTLNTYSYEIYSNFVYNPTSNAAFVNSGVFHAVPHMVSLEKYAEQQGYAVFFLTGRPESQRAGTIANLTNEGYDVQSSNLYLKDYTVDTWLTPCAPACTTIQYKSLTRAYIESQGWDIVGNFGDQYSDLTGGYADQDFKLPNPMYYLP